MSNWPQPIADSPNLASSGDASNMAQCKQLQALKSLGAPPFATIKMKNAKQHKPRPIIKSLYAVFHTDYARPSLAAEISHVV
jgi:hypothetical protein